MISALTLAGQLAAKRSRWQCRNGQKLKTCRPFKSDHQPRVCTRPTPRPAPPAPPNTPEHRTDTAVWSMHEYGCSCSHSARADRARRWQGDRAPAARSAAAAGIKTRLKTRRYPDGFRRFGPQRRHWIIMKVRSWSVPERMGVDERRAEVCWMWASSCTCWTSDLCLAGTVRHRGPSHGPTRPLTRTGCGSSKHWGPTRDTWRQD